MAEGAREREGLEEDRQARMLCAIRAGGDDPYVLGEAGFVIGYFEHEIDPAVVLIDRSLELNPSSAIGWFRSGWLRLWAGQIDLGMATSKTLGVLIRFGQAHPHSVSLSVISSRAAWKGRS
jgi:hypothetical protein